MVKLTEFSNKTCFNVRLIPKAAREKVVGEYNSALKVQLTAPPVDGQANQALIKFLAKRLGIKKSQVELISGHKSKDKKIGISEITFAELSEKIDHLLKGGKK